MVWLLEWCFSGTPNRGSRCISDSFVCSSDSFPLVGLACQVSVWVILPCVTVCVFALFCCCCCCIVEVCSFLKMKLKGSGFGGIWGSRRNEGRGNCGHDVSCKRNIYFQYGVGWGRLTFIEGLPLLREMWEEDLGEEVLGGEEALILSYNVSK